jgi:formyltetrahydrofolate deformylase
MSEASFILTLTSDPLPGIIAAVSTSISDLGGNITETNQHWDRPANRFFLRVAFVGPEGLTIPDVEQALAPTVERLGLELKVVDATRPPKIVAMVSKFDHALLHLLYQIRVGWLSADVAAIVSNHEDARRTADHEGIRFVHLPVTPETKPAQEAALLALVEETGAELVILARYMQVLSDDLTRQLSGRAINIHHSFLPAANMSASGHTSAGYDHFKLLIENNLCGVLEFVSNSSCQSRGRTRAFGHECAWFECGETARPSRPMLASRGYQAPIGWTRL